MTNEPKTIKCPHCEGWGFVQVCPNCGQGKEGPASAGCPDGFHHMSYWQPKVLRGARGDRYAV
jgi:hypothetical protein